MNSEKTSLTAEKIEERKKAVIERYGPWISCNLHLGEGVYTMGDRETPSMDTRIKAFIQIIADFNGGTLENLRVLELASLEGYFGIEFALHGAKVVSIEVREASIEKARFVKEMLQIDNIEFIQDDVRNFSKEKYGSFDVIIFAGILYHLETPDSFEVLEKIGEACEQIAIIDTHISMTSEEVRFYKGFEYRGRIQEEHEADSNEDEKVASVWMSIDNPTSFWFTRASLLNLLARVGFTSVHQTHMPYQGYLLYGYVTYVAFKGKSENLLAPRPGLKWEEDYSETYHLPPKVITPEEAEREKRMQADWVHKNEYINQLESHIRKLEATKALRLTRRVEKWLNFLKRFR